MSRSAAIRIAFAVTLFAVSLWLVVHPRGRSIDRADAEARAAKLLAAYVEQTGEPPVHFAARRSIATADGWEFTWTYRPCAETAELRIAVRRSGAAAYVVLPDCAPTHGLAVRPERV